MTENLKPSGKGAYKKDNYSKRTDKTIEICLNCKRAKCPRGTCEKVKGIK